MFFQKLMQRAKKEKEAHPDHRNDGSLGPVAEEKPGEYVDRDCEKYIRHAKHGCIRYTDETKIFQVTVQHKKYRQQYQVKRVSFQISYKPVHFLIMRYSMRSVPGIFI